MAKITVRNAVLNSNLKSQKILKVALFVERLLMIKIQTMRIVYRKMILAMQLCTLT